MQNIEAVGNAGGVESQILEKKLNRRLTARPFKFVLKISSNTQTFF